MNKSVMVTVFGKQTSDAESEPIEVTTPGEYYFENGMHCIKYDEIAEGKDQISNILLKAGPDKVEMTRTGFINGELYFSEGKMHTTSYELPFGNIYMTTNTREMNVAFGEDEILIDIDYELSMNDERISDNIMKIRISNEYNLN